MKARLSSAQIMVGDHCRRVTGLVHAVPPRLRKRRQMTCCWCDHEDAALLANPRAANERRQVNSDISSTPQILARYRPVEPGDWDVVVMAQTVTGGLPSWACCAAGGGGFIPFADIPPEIAIRR